VKNAHTESKTPPVESHVSAPAALLTIQAELDRDVLHAALTRLGRLLGYQDEHSPEHTNDLDTTGLSAKYAGLVQWAKGAKLP
jgi:hypothetical protein